MPLQFQTVQSAFRLGVDESTDPHHVEFGTLLKAENVEWVKNGRIQKRLGTTALTGTWSDTYSSGTIASCKRLFTRGNELCLIDGQYIYSYADSVTGWKRVTAVPELGIETEPLADTLSGTRASDIVKINGLVYHAWVGGDPYTTTQLTGTLFLEVIDPSTGTRVLQPTSLGNYNGMGVRLLNQNGVVLVLICHKLGPDFYISYQQYNATTFALLASGDLVAPMNASGAGWDAIMFGASNVILSVQIPGGAPNIKLYKYDNSLALVATGTSTEASATQVSHMALGTDGTTVWFAYFNNGAVKLSTFNGSTMAQTLAPVVVESVTSAYGMGIVTTDSTHCLLVYSVSTTAADLIRTASAVFDTTATPTTGSQRGTWFTRIASKPFLLGSRYYVAVAESPYTNVFGGGTNAFLGVNTQLLEVETSTPVGGTSSVFTPHRPLGKIDHLVGGVYAEFYSPPPNVVAYSETETLLTSMYVTIVAPGSRMQSMKLVHATIDADRPADMWRCVTHGQEAYLAAGSVTAYDGRSAFDYGFSRPPFLVSQTSSAGTFDAGRYLYGWTYEYRSAAGVLHRSPTFVSPGSFTNTGTGVTSVVSGNPLSTKQNYRTNFGTSAGLLTTMPTFRSIANGDVLQRLTSDPLGTFYPQSAVTATYTVVDGGSDSNIDGLGHTLATRPTIYTAGGALDDEQPPSVLSSFLYKSRIFVLANDGMTWWYSKSFLANPGVAPGFSSSFQLVFDEPQTGGATLDDKAVFFGPAGIHYMQGDGPQSSGAANDFTTPARIQSDVGCSNARSIVSMPDGIMFQSRDGQIHLLTRSLEVVRIGRPIQDTINNYPNITSAVVVPKKNQVRFTANNFGSTNGVVFVYDYQVKQWSVFRYYDTTTSTASCPIADAVMWKDKYTFATTGGAVFTDGLFSLDGDTHWVTMLLETAWFNAAGPLGFESVRKFAIRGLSRTEHDLTIGVGFDGDEATFPQTVTFLAGSAVTKVSPLSYVEHAEITINTKRKCDQIRFQVYDATPTNPGTYPVTDGFGPMFETMAIEVGVKQGPRPVSATRKG